MSGPSQPDILRVSLEPHLAEKLRPLVHTIPGPLSAELSPLLSETSSSSTQTPTISYTLLSSLSRWVRTEEGARALKSEDPPLDPLAYGMIALLAGTRTSPDKKFPQSWPSSSRSEGAAREINDRRAIVAVLNAFLSVICTGAGVWWAAQRTGWRDEWKVLLSLLAATIVAVSEVGLYIIWESRRRQSQRGKTEVNRLHPPNAYAAGDSNSGDVGVGEASSEPVHLDSAPSQASTSIDPSQVSARTTLRQRVGATAKSRSR